MKFTVPPGTPTCTTTPTTLDDPAHRLVFDDEWTKWKEAHRMKLSGIAAMLRAAADQLERTGMPMIENNAPGWGDVLLITDRNAIDGGVAGPFMEPVLDGRDGKIKVIVGPRGVNNCTAVVVLPERGQSVRVTAEVP